MQGFAHLGAGGMEERYQPHSHADSASEYTCAHSVFIIYIVYNGLHNSVFRGAEFGFHWRRNVGTDYFFSASHDEWSIFWIFVCVNNRTSLGF